jgi:protein involved in polysaccharide export with SLBB domain
MKFRNILIPLCILLSTYSIFAVELHSNTYQLEQYRNFIQSYNGEELKDGSGESSIDTLFSAHLAGYEESDSTKKYFGYDYFTNRNNIEIWNNLPASSDYELGPGDEIIINIWGDTQVNYTNIIDRQGKIFIDKVGLISLSGQTLQNAEEILINRFSYIYSTLAGKKPTSSLDISLGELKSLNISLVGEVAQPGLHKIHPFSTLTTCLFQIGGVNTSGTLRNIQIYRKNKLFKTFDFYTFFTGLNFSQDTQLKDGDIISIPPRISTIEIQGASNRVGYYEILSTETVANALEFSGGFSSDASGILVVDRALIQDQIEYLESSDFETTSIKNGDVITVFEKPSLSRSVAIYGQVKLPGEYPFSEKMDIMKLLSIAGGIDDPTFLESMYLKKAQVVRRSYSEEYPEVILVDLDEAIKGKSSHNIDLKNLDVIIVNQNPNYESPQRVDITGEVNIPGVYTIQENGETLDDILSRAGGFSSKAYDDGIQMYRDSSQVVLQNYDIVVMDGDSLHVPKHPGIVSVKGEVYNPGLVQFKKGKTLRHYIERAGGYNIYADNSRVVVFYANGDVKIKKWYSNPKIKEGATIIVYPRVLE